MASIQQQVSAIVNNDIQKKFSHTKLKQAAEKAAEKSIEIMIRRNMQGLDVNGKQFAPYTKNYQKAKAAYIRKGKGNFQLKANRMPNHMRLSGQLLGSITYDKVFVSSNTKEVQISFRVYIPDDQSGKVKGLYANTGKAHGKTYSKASRKFFGLSTTPVKNIQEKNEIMACIQKVLNYSVSGNYKNLTTV